MNLFDVDRLWAPNLQGFRQRKREWTLAARGVTGLARKADQRTLRVLCREPELLDDAHRVFDADCERQSPGRIVVNGEWFQRCLVPDSEPEDGFNPFVAVENLTFLLLDGGWRRLATSARFDPSSGDIGGQWLTYPHGYEYTYRASAIAQSMSNRMLQGAPFVWRIFGPVVSPYMVIVENSYRLNATVPAGAYVTVTAFDDEKTIVQTDIDGQKQNLFSAGERGSGKGSGSYIFEPLPAGDVQVSWPGNFAFELDVFETGLEPPWSTLS